MIVRHDGVIRSQVVLVAIGFNLAEKLPAGPIDVAFMLQENVWNGRTTVQLNIPRSSPGDAVTGYSTS